MAQPLLSVIIPSYNEKKNLDRGVLDEVYEYLQQQSYTWELLLSDDGSSDGTATALDVFAQKKARVRVLHNEHAGKGPTVQSGMLAAQGKWRLFTDFDQSTPLSELKKLWPFSETYPIVIGSREIAGAVRAQEPLHRHIMGKVFNLIVQNLVIRGIQDTQCGFKLMSADATQQLFSRLYVYGRSANVHEAFTGAFDVEVLYLAKRLGFAIKEVPVAWQHYSTSRVSPLRDSLKMLRDIITIRIADLRGKYAPR